MKREFKGFVCGVLITVIVWMSKTSATAATENIPAFWNTAAYAAINCI